MARSPEAVREDAEACIVGMATAAGAALAAPFALKVWDLFPLVKPDDATLVGGFYVNGFPLVVAAVATVAVVAAGAAVAWTFASAVLRVPYVQAQMIVWSEGAPARDANRRLRRELRITEHEIRHAKREAKVAAHADRIRRRQEMSDAH